VDARSLLALATGGRENELRLALLEYVGRTARSRMADADERVREPIAFKIEEDDRANVATPAG
jgi:hypothetical protein